MEFHGKKIIENSPLAIHKPPLIPEISRSFLPVNLLPKQKAYFVNILGCVGDRSLGKS